MLESTGVPIEDLPRRCGGERAGVVASAAVVAECFIDRMDAAITQLDAA